MTKKRPEDEEAATPAPSAGSDPAPPLTVSTPAVTGGTSMFVGGDRNSPAKTGLRKLFEAAVTNEASDILLRGGAVPKVRLRGLLKRLDVPPLDVDQFETWVEQSLSPAHKKTYLETGSLDMGFDLPMKDGSIHRFRVNVFRTRGRSAMAARRVNNKILNVDQLHLPKQLEQIAEARQGLVILAGITGSGKSTTIAAMLQHINQTRPCHIVTLEDPIEYLFVEAKATINQREVGIDVADYEQGLRSMVRENPDVVLIGEMRDRETFEAGLQAAETGHLVFGTIHASSSSQVFGRIYDLFPKEDRDVVRNLLAYQMHAFIYQKLVETVREEPGRVPALEILLQSPPTRKYILDGKEHELGQVIRGARDAGMLSFNDSLVELVETQFISPRMAMAVANNPEELRLRLKGIETI
ncbi:MAG: PilT/PilU family type 4a pilus ATPase [Planctomycetes bacterium]|nr:PilT/PilU family type 4a pilus ATPase [Planctomycetota bacterium]